MVRDDLIQGGVPAVRLVLGAEVTGVRVPQPDLRVGAFRAGLEACDQRLYLRGGAAADRADDMRRPASVGHARRDEAGEICSLLRVEHGPFDVWGRSRSKLPAARTNRRVARSKTVAEPT